MGVAERRQREREARKQTILEAATEVFGRRGYADTAMETIAARAHVNIATVYYYFASKEILYLAVLASAMENALPTFLHAADSVSSAREKLRAMALAYSDFYTRHPDLLVVVRYLKTNGHDDQDDARQLAQQALVTARRALECVRKTLAEGADRGELGTVDTRETPLLLWAALNGVLRLERFLGRDDQHAPVERWIELTFDGLAAR